MDWDHSIALCKLATCDLTTSYDSQNKKSLSGHELAWNSAIM